MKERLPTTELRPGMFVAELDRPWLGTPFLLQGFLIEDEGEIEVLRQYCRTVLIDRMRSTGEHHASRPSFKNEKKTASRSPDQFTIVDEAQADDFPKICEYLRTAPSHRKFSRPPSIDPADGQSRLEPELLYSAPLIDDVKRILQSVHETLDAETGAKFEQIGNLVHEIAASVQRNPDALLWLTRLRSSDRYSYDHAVDVSIHLMIFARFLNLPNALVENLGLTGMMQDIGKIDLPQEILNKPGELSEEEYTLVQSHVASSIEMLLGQPTFPKELIDIVAGHHERHDGSGYPRRLAGDKIKLEAEMAGLIDAYCAMTRKRAYNPAVSHHHALEELIEVRGRKFRAPLVDQFIQCMGVYPVGTLVELNSGEAAVVIQQNRVRRLQPRVFVVLAADKSVERYPRTLDLLMHPASPSGEPYRIMRSLPPDAYGIDPRELYLA